MTRVVCALSGGSAKGAAHVGALRALEECGHEVAHYVGTSIGAVVAAMFASGLDYDEILRRITTLSRRDVATPSTGLLIGPFASSLFSGRVWRETIATLVPAREFDDLTAPLTVTAVSAETGDLVLFGAGGKVDVPLVDALYASSALPVYFPAGEIESRRYVDGGLRAVLPLDVADRFAPDLLFGVHVGPVLYERTISSRAMPGLLDSHRLAMRILLAAQAEETLGRWRREHPDRCVIVDPRIREHGTFAVDRVVAYVERGYRAAMRALTDWEAA